MDGNHITYSLGDDGRRYFTNADLADMVEQGLIDPDDRWELIRGEWFDMPSESFEHMDVRTVLHMIFSAALKWPTEYRVSSEGSFFLSHDTELRPDLAIYRADVGTNEMSGTDLFLVAEVMKTSQRRDKTLKAPIYAEVNVPELWLIDLDANTITVMRDPSNGKYRSETTVNSDHLLSALNFPEISISLDMLRGQSDGAPTR
ncbi:MAG: Uma2 family endonuclease [Pseudomonadota bacterium]